MKKIKIDKIRISFIISIMGVVALIVGTSYAIFNTVLESSKEQVIKVGSIALKYTDLTEKDLIGLEELTDEEGIVSDNYYSFSIENIGTEKTYYEVMLISDEESNNSLEKVLDDKYIRASIEVDEVVKPVIDIEEVGRIIYQDTINAGITKNYKLRLWLNFDGLTTEEKQTLLKQAIYFKIKVTASQITELPNLDESGASIPELATGMIPVYYDETANTWKKASSKNNDENNRWYDYDNKMWANAVTVSDTNRTTYLNASLGTPISMDDINTMWVWIPRFSATGDTVNYNGGTQANPGAFNITFVDNKKVAHDAFTFGTNKLNGFWVGKFENSSNITCTVSDNSVVELGCNLTTIRPNIKPDAISWRGVQVSTIYIDISLMTETNNHYGLNKLKNTTLDTHMMKNNEWGAVAYLTQSIYGRCISSTNCTEVGINNNSSYITGYGAPDGSNSSATNGTYETDLGKNASTTGNIYGVYDMSGGSFEYVMGVYTDGIKNWSGYSTSNNNHSGFSGCLGSSCSSTYSGLTYPESKYYNSYTNTGTISSPITNYTSNMQHALIEIAG